jgi:hypothetical protein
VLLLAALGDGNVARFSDRLIVEWAAAEQSQRWPNYFFFQFLEVARVLPDYKRQRELMRLLDFALDQFAPLETLRWAVLSQYNHPENPSALLFIARSAHLRALLSPLSLERLRWHGVAVMAAVLHRRQPAFLWLWGLWHRLRHGKKLRPKPYPGAYRGHFLHPRRPMVASMPRSASQ